MVGGVEYMCVDFGVDIDVFDLNKVWFVIVKDSVCNRVFVFFGDDGYFDVILEGFGFVLISGWDFDVVFFGDNRGWDYVYVRVGFFYDVCNYGVV